MSEVERILENIDHAYAKFREERCDLPTHLIMDIGAKQALKIYLNPFPAELPRADIVTYLGVPIIDLEKVVIVDSQNLEAKGMSIISKPKVYTQKWGVDHGYYKKEEMDRYLENLIWKQGNAWMTVQVKNELLNELEQKLEAIKKLVEQDLPKILTTHYFRRRFYHITGFTVPDWFKKAMDAEEDSV